jgi:hypothetical protein
MDGIIATPRVETRRVAVRSIAWLDALRSIEEIRPPKNLPVRGALIQEISVRCVRRELEKYFVADCVRAEKSDQVVAGQLRNPVQKEIDLSATHAFVKLLRTLQRAML